MAHGPILPTSYLDLGLAGLARAHDEGDANRGHYGAGLIAAYLLSADHPLPAATLAGLHEQVERFIAHNQRFLTPYPNSAPRVGSTEARLIAALATNVDRLCAIGHNVIFAVMAIRALRRLGRDPGERQTASLCALITDLSSPVTSAMGIDLASLDVAAMVPYRDGSEVAVTALREMPKFVRVYAGLFAGWVGHVVTLGHAVVELDRLGHSDLARRAHAPHRLLVAQAALLHRHPPDGLVENGRVPWSPLQPEFWQRDYAGNNWAFAHTCKYPLAYLALRPAITDAQEQGRLDEAMTRIWN